MRTETEAAIRAAAIAQRIADSRQGGDQITSKGGIDLVTASDVACEDAIRAELLRSFPEYPVIGEERGGTPVDGKPYWLVDPICGTRAFASEVPLYCTNIALGDRCRSNTRSTCHRRFERWVVDGDAPRNLGSSSGGAQALRAAASAVARLSVVHREVHACALPERSTRP